MALRATRGWTVLSALALLSCLALLNCASALTMEEEFVEFQTKVAGNPKYKSLLKFKKYTRKALKASGGNPITILAPTDGAMKLARSNPKVRRAGIARIFSFHVLQGLLLEADLKKMDKGAKLTTLDGTQVMLKASDKGAMPIRLRSPLHPESTRVLAKLYSGKHLAVFGIDSILSPI